MKEKIYTIMVWVILALLLGSLIAKAVGGLAASQLMWWGAIALIAVWLVLRATMRRG